MRLLILPCLLVLAGCRIGGSTGVDAANDALRAENTALKARVETLRGERDEWRTKAEAMAADPTLRGALAALPAVVELEIGALSGVELRAEGAVAVIYVATLDGRRRFTPAVGSVELSITAVERDAGRTSGERAGRSERDGAVPEWPRNVPTLATASYGPEDVSAAYRSGFTGTHYVFEIPLRETGIGTGPKELKAGTAARVRVKFRAAGAKVDGGEGLSAEREVRVRQGRAGAAGR